MKQRPSARLRHFFFENAFQKVGTLVLVHHPRGIGGRRSRMPGNTDTSVANRSHPARGDERCTVSIPTSKPAMVPNTALFLSRPTHIFSSNDPQSTPYEVSIGLNTLVCATRLMPCGVSDHIRTGDDPGEAYLISTIACMIRDNTTLLTCDKPWKSSKKKKLTSSHVAAHTFQTSVFYICEPTSRCASRSSIGIPRLPVLDGKCSTYLTRLLRGNCGVYPKIFSTRRPKQSRPGGPVFA